MKNLRKRVQNFLDELGVPLTTFCRKVNLSTQSIRQWVKYELNLSYETEKRIDEYLTKYGF